MRARHGLVIDLERCVGCHTCTIACMIAHDLDEGAGIVVQTIGGKDRDTPEGKHPNLHMHFLPIICMHCSNAPCMEECPNDSIIEREDGIVLINEPTCDGCLNCVSSCPYNAIFYNEKEGSVWKCNMCADRIDEGLEPFCVICCEGEAMVFGDLNDPASRASQMITKRRGQKLVTENDTAIYYCPTRKGCIH
jgi:dimethyl sulfoxide reductase iron-sulfur subunit